MEYINQIVTAIIDSFDFGYCVSVNILTYLIIKFIDEINGNKKVTTWQKRGVLILSIICVSAIYYNTDISLKVLINSAILAPVFWSWICKPICNKLGIDYNKDINLKDL